MSSSGQLDLCRLLLDSGRSSLEGGRLDQAVRALAHALELARAHGFGAEEARARVLEGRAALRAGDLSAARDALATGLSLIPAGEDEILAAEALVDLAEVDRRSGDPASAETSLRASLLRSSREAPGPIRARALEDLALILRQQGKAEEAIASLEEARRIREAVGDRAGVARVLTGLGNALHRSGAIEASLARHREALALQQEVGDQKGIAHATSNVGALLIEMADYAAAAEHLERAHDLLVELKEDESRAAVATNLGLLWSYRGDGKRADQYLKQALAFREAAGDHDRAAGCLSNLASVAAMAGRDEDAVALAERAIALRRDRAPEVDQARPWFQIGASLLRLGRRDEAEGAARQLRRIAENARNDDLVVESLLLDARLALDASDHAGALERAQGAAAHAGTRNARGRGEALRLQGEAQLALGRLDLAREVLLEGETVLKGLPSPELLAALRLTLGSLFRQAGAYEAAAERLRRAAEMYASMGNSALEARALLGLGFAEWTLDRRRARESLAEARRAAARSGRAELLREVTDELERWEQDAVQGFAPLLDLSARLARATNRADSLRAFQTWAETLPGVLRVDVVSEPGGITLLAPGGRELGSLAVQRDPAAETSEAPLRVGAQLLAFALGNFAGEEDAVPRVRVPETTPGGLVGQSPALARVLQVIAKIAPTDASVLIEGESGTGKELAARALHERSARALGPFVAINCPTIPRDLIEAELFGHEKGAFTGAHGERRGQIEAAHGGTLFLDELGDMDQASQVKLLRFLEERSFLRVGGRVPIQVDVRLVAATSRNLEDDVREGRFREDLYYRLNVVPLVMPPLRARREDVPPLFAHFASEVAARTGRAPNRLAPEAETALRKYTWPGNVRELRNLAEFLSALHPGESIRLDTLPDRFRRVTRDDLDVPLRAGETLDARVMGVEGALLRQALEEAGGNQSEAARLLGITETRLRLRLRRYGLSGSRQAPS